LESEVWRDVSQPVGRPGPGRKAPDYDALMLRGEISAPSMIRNVQAVVVVRLAKDGEFADISYTAAVGDVGPQPRRLEILRDGIPPGYEVKESRLHLFSQAEELPSTLSEKLYQITAAEAREYLRLVHLDLHRGENVPGRPAWPLVPPSFFGMMDGADIDYSVQVDLDEQGRLVRVRDDVAVVPAQVRSALEKMVFLPALENGVAVASTVTINPADFYR
jgi:hypothetical protein